MISRKTAAIAVLSIGTLTACGSSTTSAPSSSVSVSSRAGSTTDVAFAQSMIPHHEQAIEMANLALTQQSGASQQVQELARQIQAAQDPEIAQMTGWLQRWGAPTAMPRATSASTMPGMGHDMGGMTVAGMMTAGQMRALGQARGQDFDRMWLTMMIAHHQGAISMAQQVKADNSDPDVQALAQNIITGQQQEITTMQDLLANGQ